jgi:hypothetical protein
MFPRKLPAPFPHIRAIQVSQSLALFIDRLDKLGRVTIRGYPDRGQELFGYSARGLIAYTNQIGASNFRRLKNDSSSTSF